MGKVKVLFFAADPLSADGHKRRLLLDEEAQKIEQEVFAALHRDRVDFRTCWATRIKNLRRGLSRAQPQIVHFSGHGGSEGLVLVSTDGMGAHRVDADALRDFFQAFSGKIRVVVLNACHSQRQAEAIAEAVGCAIGTPTRIKDAAAIAFSAAFYSSIAFGNSVQTAFDQARATLRMEDFADGECPVLITRPDVDASKLVLVSRRRSRLIAMASTAVLLTCGAAVVNAAVKPPLPQACETARELLHILVPETEAPAIQGLMGGATASAESAGPAERMADARDLYEAGDFAAAFPLFLEAARAGNEEAMSYVGVAYLRGEGVAANADSARVWLEPAKDSRDPRGMNGLGEAYQRGFGAQQRNHLAVHWYREAAEKEFPEALRNLGNMYRDGLSVEPSGASALEHYVRAARAGLVDAMADAGAMYERGLAVPADAEAARCWYDAAARAGSPRGMVERGRMHEDGREYEQAREWYEKAAAKGNADAMNNLGRLYQNGLGVDADVAQARRWYQLAVDAGSAVARGNLARLRAG